MSRNATRVLVAASAAALVLTGAPLASAQGVPGSVPMPIVVPRPFDIPIWQLPPLPYPLEWQFHSAPAPAPKYGDPCHPDQVFEVYDRRLVCVYAGAPTPRWVYVAAEALNPDGTLNRDYPAG